MVFRVRVDHLYEASTDALAVVLQLLTHGVCVRMLTGHVVSRTHRSNLGLGHSVNRAHFLIGAADSGSLSAATGGVQSAA